MGEQGLRQAGWYALLVTVVVVLAGCGNSGGGATTTRTPGNPPLVLVSKPRHTGYHMPSPSMQPTLHCARPFMDCHASDPDRLLVKPYSNAPRRSDIIAFSTPPRAKQDCGAGGVFVKRVVGLPGETVAVRTGVVFIDGKKLSETYVESGLRGHQSGRWQVPGGEYFMMGDNRTESCDSRYFGPVPMEKIIGKVVTIFRLR